MTAKPEPDKLGRNMKALPSAMWNRAIPENDYIQLGTLRYGVRLSNAGLLDAGKPGHVVDLAEGHSRASVGSYDIPNGGNGGTHSVTGTSSISSNGDRQNCCCIGSSGVEMPWTTSYARTKLPVPSSLAKNRKSSPLASPTVGASGVEGHQQQQQQQQLPRYPLSAANRTNNNGHGLSQSTQPHDRGSDDYTSESNSALGAGYTNGFTHKSSSNTGSRSSNGEHRQLEPAEESTRHQDTSPRCSTVVCCYSNSFGVGGGNKKQPAGSGDLQQCGSDIPDPVISSVGYVQQKQQQQQHQRNRSIGFSTTTLDRLRDGAGCDSTGGWLGARRTLTASGTRVGSELGDDTNEPDGDDDLSALVTTTDGSDGTTSGRSYRNGGDDLNLNSKNAPRHLHRSQQVPQGQRWQPGQGGANDVNINNFEKRKISTEQHGIGGVGGVGSISTSGFSARIDRTGGSSGGVSVGVGGGRNITKQNQSTPIGDLCVDELSSTSSLSPRSASPAVQHATTGCVLTPDSPTTGQLHPPPIATPFGQRRRALQPPSSLPVVKSYSFHRVPSDAFGTASPTTTSGSPSHPLEGPTVGYPALNRSFRNTNHSRRLQYGYVDDVINSDRQNGTPPVTRKSSLPVLGSSGSHTPPGGRYLHLTSSRTSSIDECYPFDKSSCQPECVLTPRSHRKLPCSDALNEIRLQSLNKYCNQLLGRGVVTFTGADSGLSTVAGSAHDRVTARAIDELEDLSFIDSSDLSSTGDDGAVVEPPYTDGHRRAHQRKRHPSINATIVSDGNLPTTVSGRTLASTGHPASGGCGSERIANRNNHADSTSSDDPNHVCSGVTQLTRRNSDHQWQQQPVAVLKYRAQCTRNGSNASDDYPAARYCAELGVAGASSQPNTGVSFHGVQAEPVDGVLSEVVDTRGDTNNNYHRSNSDVDSDQQQHQQQQQKYTSTPANNSAGHSVRVGGVGVEPGRPGGVGEQTPDNSCTSPLSHVGLRPPQGYASSGCPSPDGSPAGLNCFGRSGTQLHGSGGVAADRSIMEKRNNTLDRLQRLVKKTTSSSSEKPSNSASGAGSNATTGGGGSKTERLRELTELLKGNRGPPVPPPRRPKHANSVERTFDRQNVTLSTSSLIDTGFLHGADSSLPESQLLKAKESRSVDIPYRFADGAGQRMSTPSSPLTEHKPVNLRANVSTSNLEALHEPPETKPALGDECKSECTLKDADDLFTKLSRPESRTIVGSYTQKTIPFRSASFSQVDYSSGKYIRSALGALKNSILKSRDQQQSSVDSNTIPRSSSKALEAARSCSPTELCGDQTDQASQPEPDTDVAKLTIKKTELNINLAPLDDYGRYFEDRLEGKDLSSNRNSDIETIVEDPVAEHDENVENELHQCAPGTNMSVLQASEMVLEPLVEEGIPITPTSLSKDDECLQQATTCLIPVPVYDCVVSEWSTARPSEQWIDASTTEYGKFSDCLDSIKEVNESAISDVPGRVHSPEECHETSGHSDTITVETPPQIVEPQDSVELSEDGATSDPADLNDDSKGLGIASLLCTPPVSIICTEPESNEYTTIVDGSAPTHKVSVVLGDGNEIEVVEVRKRHSNNEDTGDPLNCRLSNDVDEKRRLESRKSRRKGIYFQWPAIDGNSELESDNNDTPAVDEAGVSWNPEALAGQVTEKDSSLDLSGESFTDLSGKDPGDRAVRSPERYLLDPITPDSDPGKPVWPKGNRRQSLTYQSSDEKDDTLPVPALPVRSLKTLLLRSDSVSDNESDRASSRDRTSASPAPGSGDPDPKRYSKRPLRGPYGQMLEAEMKKPTTKVQYSEILEELTRTEGTHRPNSTGARNRGVCSQSMDETNDRHAAKAGSKPRKTSANLPVPTHVRTASSPSKLSDSSGTRSASPSKRYLCNIDQRSTDSDRSEKSTGKLESKKLSLDSHLQSEKPTKPGKQRSGSSASEKQQKRSLDEVRLSQSSRTPSERSFTLAVTPEAPKGLAASPELLAELLKGSSEKLVTEQLGTASGAGGGTNASNALPSAVLNCLDTRTHVVVELFNTEKSYVESLQTIVLKYLNQLKSPENSGLVDVQTVDEIFFMVPAILNIHERFLEELRRRLDSWDKMQMIGDAFVDVFSRPVILDTYTSFVNNWNRAKDAIRSARQKCPAFARFLEAMAREHKGKLSLDNLLIKPVQKFPNYELIFTRLIKHTDVAHPDQKPLQEALKLVHDILMFLNCKEKEALENGQRETVLRELEGVIEGMNELVTPERAFLLFDLVSMPSGQVTRKERGFFLFNDLLVITSIKRRSGTIRKTNMTCPGSVASTLDTNKYKYLTKISLDDLEIVKSKDENVRRIMKEIEHLTEDSGKLIQMSDIAASLRCPHAPLEEAVRELQREIQRQLAERQTNDAQLNVLELTWNTSNGIQNMTVVFSKPEKRTQWEEIFAEAKQKLANSLERCQIPEFFVSVPIRKTRAGLQFTCASPTLGAQKDVWVCNSDGYVGQVCVLSLVPEPSVTSCNGVCNARILCVSSVPASDERSTNSALMNVNISIVDASIAPSKSNNCSVNSPAKSNDTKASFKSTDTSGGQTRSLTNSEANVQLDSGSSSDDSDAESQPERTATNQPGTGLTANHRQQDSTASVTTTGEESENQQSTMWLGTEDGCIHVYNCTDNIRIKKNKIKIPHVSAVYSILYLDNRVFVSLANGDICVYSRDRCGWNVSSPLTVTVGTVTNPVVKLLNVHGKLWCAIQGTIKVLNTKTLQIDSQIQISNDSKPITNMTVLNDYVWISVQNSAHIKCCHHESFEVIFEVNLAPSVNKMLSNCDDIIRQHKAACLRVTSLLACKDLVWVGTSAGVLLTIGAHNVAKGSPLPTVTGLPHGHTGHVRFLTFVESPDGQSEMTSEGTGPVAASHHGQSSGKSVKPSLQELLVISGGDGYEDFRSAGNNTMSEVAGREDSTNHLLLWKV